MQLVSIVIILMQALWGTENISVQQKSCMRPITQQLQIITRDNLLRKYAENPLTYFSCSVASQQCPRTLAALCNVPLPDMVVHCILSYLSCAKKVEISYLPPLVLMYWQHIGGPTTDQVRQALAQRCPDLGGAVDITYEYEKNGVTQRLTNYSFSPKKNRRENMVLRADFNYKIIRVNKDIPMLSPQPWNKNLML